MKRSLWLILLSAACVLTLTLALTLSGCAVQDDDPTGAPSTNGGQSAAKPLTGETAEYTNGYVDMAITIPEGWRWEAVQTSGQTEGIRFWKDGDKALDFELFCWTEGYGICGTGVTSEELTLPGGATLWEHTEEMGGTLWLNLYFTGTPGSYVLQPTDTITKETWEGCRSEVLAILDTAQFGRGVMTEQQAIEAAAPQVEGAYDMAYGSFDVKSGVWTVRFSRGTTGAKAQAFTVSPGGTVNAAA